MSHEVLLGPFLTREQAARRAGVAPADLPNRLDLLHLGGTWLQEVYFAFQFDGDGVRQELAGVIRSLRQRSNDETIADWLIHPNPTLGAVSPLTWLDIKGHRGAALTEAFHPQS